MKKWAGASPVEIVTARFKRDLPPLQPWQRAERIEFRFCAAWVIRDQNGGIVCRDGSVLNVAEITPRNGPPLIGRNDPYQPGAGADLELFRSALLERAARAFASWDFTNNREQES